MSRKKTRNSFSQLPIRKQKYAIALANSGGNKSKLECLLEAGYSEHTARNPAQIETPDFRHAFEQLIREKISPHLAVKRIKEGMSAVNTTFFQKDGVVTDSRDTINWAERRNYTNLYAQMSGAWTPKAEIDHTQKVDEGTLRRLMDISDKLNVAAIPAEQLKQLEASHQTIDANDIEAANSVYDRIHAKG